MVSDKSEAMSDEIILATGGYDHTIKIWQTHTGMCQRTMQHQEGQVNCLEISPDKQMLAAASYQHIRMYDLSLNNPNAIINYEGVTKNVTRVGFQEDGKWMYSGGEDCKARIWDLRATNQPCPKYFEVGAPVTSVVLHPNQGEMFIGDQSGIIHRWDMRWDSNEQLIPEPDVMILDLAIDPTGSYLAAVNNKGRCYIWSLVFNDDTATKLNPKQKFEAHKKFILRCKFSPDSEYLVTTSADQTAKVWNVRTGELHRELKYDNQRWVWDAAFSGDSQYVFTASSDGYVKLWNVEKGTVDREYAGHQKAVTALAFRDAQQSYS